MVMMENEILDVPVDSPAIDHTRIIKRQRWILAASMLFFAILNTVVINTLFEDTTVIFGNGSSPFMVFTVGSAIWGFLLGLLVALIPYKRLSYGKKYLSASLLVMNIINLFYTVMFVLLTIMR